MNVHQHEVNNLEFIFSHQNVYFIDLDQDTIIWPTNVDQFSSVSLLNIILIFISRKEFISVWFLIHQNIKLNQLIVSCTIFFL